MLRRLHLMDEPFLFPDDGGGAAGGEGNEGGENEGQNDGAGQNGAGAEDVAGLKSALEKERGDRKTAEKQLRDLNKRLADLENAGKSDEDKRAAALKTAEDRATALEQKLRATTARVAVTDAAAKANAISGKAVYALIRDDLEFDDDGEPTNVGALIAQAKKDEPALFRAAAGDGEGGRRGDSGADSDMNANIRRAAGRRG